MLQNCEKKFHAFFYLIRDQMEAPLAKEPAENKRDSSVEWTNKANLQTDKTIKVIIPYKSVRNILRISASKL